jgi:lipopolysaccharide transport system ATP-binding protein
MGNVIEVNGISKRYRLGKIGADTLVDDFKRLVSKVRGKGDPFDANAEVNARNVKGNSKYVWALKDISFNVEQGSVVGILGRNGAGKSTLLKILSRVAEPSRGSFRIKGRVASLLEVGTGFHPDLSGAENIYLNGAILGMSRKEIASKYDEIVAFSGVERYIDTPIKKYSSGMKVRLGFAVAAHLEAEILIVDEVLAVGDAEFQSKCLAKMQNVAGDGRTVIFVSHNLSAVRNLCTRGIVIEQGMMSFEGTSSDAIDAYKGGSTKASGFQMTINERPAVPFNFTRVAMVNSAGKISGEFEFTESIGVVGEIFTSEVRRDSVIGVHLEDAAGNTIYVSTSDESQGLKIAQEANVTSVFRINLPTSLLKPGLYFISLSARGKTDKPYHKLEHCLQFTINDSTTYRGMKNLYRKVAVVAPEIGWVTASEFPENV